MRRDVCAERCEGVPANSFVSVRTCETSGEKSGAVELLIRRVLDAAEHRELLTSLLANTGLLRDNYDLLLSLFNNVNSLINKDTIELLKNILSSKNKVT